MLPRLDGWEVLERLRKQKPTPVLMLTARDAPKDRVRGLDTGADDYLVKPFDLSELLARLRALIRRSAGQARSQIELGAVLIDTRARSVTRAGQPVTLTAREYAILEYLALHRAEVVTRTALYEHLFDENEDTLRTSWTCISSAYAKRSDATSSRLAAARDIASGPEPPPCFPNRFVGACSCGLRSCLFAFSPALELRSISFSASAS